MVSVVESGRDYRVKDGVDVRLRLKVRSGHFTFRERTGEERRGRENYVRRKTTLLEKEK